MITLQLSNVFALHTIWMLARNKVFTLFRAENWSDILCGILPKCVIIAIVWYWMLLLQNRAHTKKRTVTPSLLISYQSWPPSPLSETDRVQSIKLPKSPHFLLHQLGFSQRICLYKKIQHFIAQFFFKENKSYIFPFRVFHAQPSPIWWSTLQLPYAGLVSKDIKGLP